MKKQLTFLLLTASILSLSTSAHSEQSPPTASSEVRVVKPLSCSYVEPIALIAYEQVADVTVATTLSSEQSFDYFEALEVSAIKVQRCNLVTTDADGWRFTCKPRQFGRCNGEGITSCVHSLKPPLLS